MQAAAIVRSTNFLLMAASIRDGLPCRVLTSRGLNPSVTVTWIGEGYAVRHRHR